MALDDCGGLPAASALALASLSVLAPSFCPAFRGHPQSSVLSLPLFTVAPPFFLGQRI